MYKRVLVPLDGSHFSEQALDHAAAMAKRFDVPVTHVVVDLEAHEATP